ncbi:uncharacterized protein METZ01_LOCUS322484 [marine metagenome]|uniref:Uncharacterized protein n=1 Tax=marine metagenome TaxID=408172 RepID=A0A382P9W9_9ZZZZ
MRCETQDAHQHKPQTRYQFRPMQPVNG